jgi:hypothetical protein
VVDAKATYRSQKLEYDREGASGTISQPETKNLWDLILDKELTASKRSKVAKPELGIRTGEYSNVCLFSSSSHRNYLE